MSNTGRPFGHLTTKEAAERIGVHPGSLLRMIRLGQIRLVPHSRPAWRSRRKYWFDEAKVAAVAARRQALQS